MMRFASLGSGSRGNAMVVEAGATRVLVDCGFGPRQLAQRLARLGLVPGDLDAIVVTHEHSDHVGGIARSAARYRLPVHMTHGTCGAAALDAALGVELFDSHTPFAIGELEIHPFPVPHDAREPVQFVFADGQRRCGLLTDTGHVTAHVVAMLGGCDALVVECNHDADMLARGNYPRMLKQRIAGRFGHLDNDAAADLLRQLDGRRLQHVVCAHLSRENNTPALAKAALARALGCTADWLVAADQDNGFGWLGLS
ncbi:MAG: MBL fold metallo-hydrolase [Rhodocyclaceae bacterium]|nr:MBL fold metallo-hydrolase [Rhodocyclaceae bacterium]